MSFSRRKWLLLASLALFLASAQAVGAGAVPASSTPEAATAASGYTLGASRLVLAAGAYDMYRFSISEVQYASSYVTFDRQRKFRAANALEIHAGQTYARITSGKWRNWLIAAVEMNLPPTEGVPAPPLEVQLAPGNYNGMHFYAAGSYSLRRMLRLNQTAHYAVSAEGSWSGYRWLKLANGPLAGYWITIKTGVSIGGNPPTDSPPTPPPPPTDSPPTPPPPPTDSPPTPPPPPTDSPPTPPPPPSPSPPPSEWIRLVDQPIATWKVLVLMYRDTDVTVDLGSGSTRFRSHIGDTAHSLLLASLDKTKRELNEWSGNMTAWDMTVVEAGTLHQLEPLWGGYWAAPSSVRSDIDHYAPAGTYDSIIVVWQNISNNVEIPVGGWGLTLPPTSDANGAGFSSVILGYEWWWTGPMAGEVFEHEWLHQVLFWFNSLGLVDIELHAPNMYNYASDPDGSQRHWYADILRGLVWDGTRFIGCSAEVWAAGQPTTGRH